MSFHYLLEDGSGAYLLENGLDYYLLENAPPENMPNLVGLEYLAALAALQSAGIFVPAALGYFGAYPISIVWQRSNLAPGTVLAQSPLALGYSPVNGPVTLTVSEFPVSVAFP
jgi:beta-lactam-binding protein with PASTA domain